MKQRFDFGKVEPEAYKALGEIDKYLAKARLERKLSELIKIRASQINGCAYCIESHTQDALKLGEKQNRIFALSAWWESPLFSEKEQATLKITDEVTLINESGLAENTYQNAKKYFSENEIAQIIMQIGAIGVWNRIAIATHMYHEY